MQCGQYEKRYPICLPLYLKHNEKVYMVRYMVEGILRVVDLGLLWINTLTLKGGQVKPLFFHDSVSVSISCSSSFPIQNCFQNWNISIKTLFITIIVKRNVMTIKPFSKFGRRFPKVRFSMFQIATPRGIIVLEIQAWCHLKAIIQGNNPNAHFSRFPLWWDVMGL